MKKFTKAFFLSAATLAMGFAALTSFTVEANARGGPSPYYEEDQGNNQSDDSYQGDNGESSDNQDSNQDNNNNQGGNTQEGPSGPTLNVSVEQDLSGEYGQMFKREQDKYQIFVRALNNPKDSTKGSKPVRLSIDGGDATFEGMKQDPQGVLVAISKVENNYQHFCSGANVKDGVIKGVPGQITVTLKNGNKPYKTAKGTLRNDSYPNCEVQVQ